ncbi:MAG TPA: adenylate/guanylate cyclase domain-containing protein [Actinomycetota bacterium]
MDVPRTRYAWNGDVALAYQVLGDGPTDLVHLQGWCSHVDLAWDSPYLSSFLRGLATGSRLIPIDRRGWGCSDRFSPSDVPPFEVMTDDLLAVLDAAGADRPVIFASVECAPLAILFAATYPDRTGGLILCDPVITYCATEDTPWMWTKPEWDAWARDVRGQYPLARWWSGPPDHPERAWFERYVRASIAPGALIAEFDRFLETDIRAALSTVSAPTLVLVDPAGTGEDLDPRNGRFAAERIPGARLAEVPDPEPLHWLPWYGRAGGIIRQSLAFLAEIREEEARFDRVLATVLFTDIVGSTRTSAALGDHAWRDLLERHNAIVRALLTRYRGVEVDTAGDSFFATFDGPARAARCAQAIVDAVRPLGIEIRAGLHTGEIETIDGKPGGLAVTIGARIGAKAGPSEVLVSQTVKDLVAGSGLAFEDAGEHELKGVPDRWRLYRVTA